METESFVQRNTTTNDSSFLRWWKKHTSFVYWSWCHRNIFQVTLTCKAPRFCCLTHWHTDVFAQQRNWLFLHNTEFYLFIHFHFVALVAFIDNFPMSVFRFLSSFIHPYIKFLLSGSSETTYSVRTEAQTLPSHLLKLFWENTKAYPDQLRHIKCWMS